MQAIIHWATQKKKEIDEGRITKAQKEGKIESELKNLQDLFSVKSEKEAQTLLTDKEKELGVLKSKIKKEYQKLKEKWESQ